MTRGDDGKAREKAPWHPSEGPANEEERHHKEAPCQGPSTLQEPSRALRSRPTRRAEERRARRRDNAEEDGISGAKAQQPSREVRLHKWHWAPGGAPY
jgi:hypothetical protein